MAVPAANGVMKPDEFTMAFAVLLLLHTPPGVALLTISAPLTQIVDGPTMGDMGYTVTVRAVAAHANGVNEIMAVPAATEVTRPVIVTVATAGLLLLHVPVAPDTNVVVPPLQILATPVMGKAETTETEAVTVFPHGLSV